jgi:hypothetical protein
MQAIIDTLFHYLPADGYNLTHKYQTLSNRSVFGAVYTAVFGSKPRYNITFTDTLGTFRTATVSLLQPADTRGATCPCRFRKPFPAAGKKSWNWLMHATCGLIQHEALLQWT